MNKDQRMRQVDAGRAIKRAREKLGLTRTDVSQALGVSVSLVSRIEYGERRVLEEEIPRWANALEMDADRLHIMYGRVPPDIFEFIANVDDFGDLRETLRHHHPAI